MTDEARRRVQEALDQWLVGHLTPDKPMLVVTSLGTFSVRQMVSEFSSDTPLGEFLREMIGAAVSKYSLNDVLTSFNRAGTGVGK